jgi:hypothetical protein
MQKEPIPAPEPVIPCATPVTEMTTAALQSEKERLTTLYGQKLAGAESDAIDVRLDAIDAELTARNNS